MEVLFFVSGFIGGGAVIWIILKKRYEIEINSILNESNIKITSLNQRLESEKKHLEDKIDTLTTSKDQMKQEFEHLANKIFEQKERKSNDNFSLILKPFEQQLKSFGERVNEIYSDETKQRISLLTEIKHLKDLNNQISTDTLNLTKALKGESKFQGDWGEMILSRILEQTGLKQGREYDVQGSFTNEEGRRLRPDVILHLPENKDIIIDSKVSLNAYIKYTQSDNIGKETAIKELVRSFNTHIKQLSAKEYESINEVRTLDFVLMFVPVEGAFMLAAENDNNLFKTAFENNIMIVSPSTLFVTLRTIENIWRYEHQNENAQLISKKAADLYDKFAGFVNDIEEIGKNIDRTKKAYDSALNKLNQGRGNLLRRAEEFKELGVKPKNSIKNLGI